ncbi:hypothetical protein [Demequina mangrovi]|uniref:Uncharacterized protein n=1 Tax=Demequina mangrovi TaxID=1043493 RepID=A0A1H6TSF8_9MICO|nr:hypothetical protein [Demequina mangrovi]SEI83008.1 hypothetical protein SAMN05421637_0126 [Demequina mangrovi]
MTATEPDTIPSGGGQLPVLHRLALGVMVHDAITSGPANAPLRVGWEAPPRLLPRRTDRTWPCLDLERLGTGRYRLRADRLWPPSLTVRLDDPSRRYVSRRLEVPLWTLAEVRAQDVDVRARTLHVWLWPGAAYPLPPGSTALRGRIVHGEDPVRWARLTAIDANDVVLGRAHVDDRGEFVLRVSTAGQNPLSNDVKVPLSLFAPPAPAALPPVEPVPRPPNPPQETDLDTELLRGRSAPAALVPSNPQPSPVDLHVGRTRALEAAIPFLP